MADNVVQLVETNSRDPVATLRSIADGIECGEYGPVGSVAVVVLGDTMEVLGMGEEHTPPGIALLLHAGFMRLSRAVEEHGQD